MARIKFLLFIFLLPLLTSCGKGVFIRVNRLGFLPRDIKTAVILSNQDLSKENFLLRGSDNKVYFESAVGNSRGEYGEFSYTYEIDFTDVKRIDDFVIEVKKVKSPRFRVGFNVYDGVADTLMKFYGVQRCGYTDPVYHKVCHIADATSLVIGGDSLAQKLDVTGGWHDAADYIKFFNTTAYTTYMLLFAYEYDRASFDTDNDGNGAPDILEEARIGLDWLLRADFRPDLFITQVQDLRDHDVGWRMPSEDTLRFDRPAFAGIGKNLIGLYAATMALGSRIWKTRFNDDGFADRLLSAAKQKYGIRNSVQDVDSSGTGEYLDNSYLGKLSLGAVELYLSTAEPGYLEESKAYARGAGPDHWWSWGNMNSIAHYKLARFDTAFTAYIRSNLVRFQNEMKENIFGNGVEFTWGSNHTLVGITLQNILYKSLTGSTEFDRLAVYQRDYLLGRNPWGIGFIHGIGDKYSRHFHHQVAYFMDGHLPGGFAAGPIARELAEQYDIEYENGSRLEKFQAPSAVYRDDRMDYLTNEPTISANAAAVFVMGVIQE